MARPISWQAQLATIHRRVAESPRSPYHREDLEKLFGIGERATQSLMELMPRMRMANLQVVEREHLLEFLAGALDAEDLRAYLDQLRKDPPRVTRRKVRMAVPRDFEPGNIQSIDRWNIVLSRGKIEIHFTTLEDVMSKLYQLLRVVDDADFERRFCEAPKPAAPSPEEVAAAEDLQRMRAESKALHKIESVREALRRMHAAKDLDEAAMLREIASALRDEASAALACLGPESAEVSRRASAMLAELFPQSSVPCARTCVPGSTFPLEAVPSPHPKLSDRSA